MNCPNGRVVLGTSSPAADNCCVEYDRFPSSLNSFDVVISRHGHNNSSFQMTGV